VANEENRGIYSIGAVARMLGTRAATIRNWEERYGKVVPHRSPGGHRLYSHDQVEQLRFVAEQVERGLSASDAHRLLEEPREGDRPAADQDSSRPGGVLVLLAERDRLAAEPEELGLRSAGYEVRLALTAREAEELWREHRPRLGIVELMISGGQGAELCRRLKRQGGGRLLAISTLEAEDEALAAGADVFLQKPFDPLELVSTVKDLLAGEASVDLAAEGTR
jgi:DNA-binding transcriptional MerR regulator